MILSGLPPYSVAIATEGGFLTQPYITFLNSVIKLDILSGTGSPEGVFEAQQGQEYMDTSGVAGAIKYIKRDTDILGDKTKGWILI